MGGEGLTPKITDFGLAKCLDAEAGQTRSGDLLGTPSYMTPEQARGSIHEIGPHTDVYALGAILYECLTGRPPFRAATVETLDLVRQAEPLPPRQLQPKCPRDLEIICLKCLGKEPGKRYATAQELADDLHRPRWLDLRVNTQPRRHAAGVRVERSETGQALGGGERPVVGPPVRRQRLDLAQASLLP